MKIIQIIGSLGDGGAERVVLNLDKLFRREGFISKIVVLKEKTFYNIDNSLIINLNIHKSKAKEPLIKLLRDEKPNVILVHMQDMSRLIKDLDWDNIYNFIHTDIYERLNHINFFRRYKKRKDFKCPESAVREKELNRQLSSLIQKVSLPKDWAEELLKMANDDHGKSAQSLTACVYLRATLLRS